MKNRDESERVSAPASQPLEFSRDGGKTWEVIGTVNAVIDLGPEHPPGDPLRKPLVRAWIRIL